MQSTPLPIARARDQARDALRDLIASGALPGDARLEETELSQRLGVSRTPIREALISLEEEGLVLSRPNRGFVVVAANEALVRELYPILAALEGMAMRLSAPALLARLPEMRRMTEQLRTETKKARQYALDHSFHAILTDGCGNARLLRQLQIHRAQAKRFDGAEGRGTADREGSCGEHFQIIDALEAGDVDTAVRTLERHWFRGIEVVAGWLKDKS